MTSDTCNYSAVVWEWLHDSGQWLPYSPDVTLLLDRSNSKKLTSVCLGDGEANLANYTVHLKDMVQISQATEFTRPVRRQIYSCQSPAAWGVIWQWTGDSIGEWQPYAMEVACVLEDAYRNGLIEIDLSNYFAQMKYTINLVKMMQTKNCTGFQRQIKRTLSQPYVMTKMQSSKLVENSCNGGSHVCPMSKSLSKNAAAKKDILTSAIHVSSVNKGNATTTMGTNVHSEASTSTSNNHKNIQKAHDLNNQSKSFKSGILKVLSAPAKALIHHINSPHVHSSSAATASTISSSASADNYPKFLPGHIPKSSQFPVPGIEPPSAVNKRVKRKRWDDSFDLATGEEMLKSYSKQFNKYQSDECCCICCEPLSGSSGYGDDDTVICLNICDHVFHKLCILAMHESSNQAQYLQCPTCKTIHGVKTGNQPFGKIDYHVLHHSLPTFNCDTIRVIYDINSGVQTAEHPNPGKPYTARAFPRVGYLPDNEDGRKVLRLLIKAWERRLIFTVGSSVTSGETDTVTWNEIHHKTEFGTNYSGHGYPDDNYISNVLLELASQGIVE